MSDVFDRAEFLSGYLAEVEEHLQNANGQLLRLEAALDKGESQLRMIRELFRALHTIKGLSAMVGVEPIVELAHEMETLLRVHDQGSRALQAPALELLFRGLRELELRVRAFGQHRPVEAAPAPLLVALAALQSGTPQELAASAPAPILDAEIAGKLTPSDREQLVQGMQQGLTALRLDFSPSPEKAAAGLSITSLRERLGTLADVVKVVPRSVTKSEAAPSGLTFSLLLLTSASPSAIAACAGLSSDALLPIALSSTLPPPLPPLEEDALLGDALQHDTIRVEVSRLDAALEKLGELVVTRFALDRAVRALRDRDVDVRELEVVMHDHRRALQRVRGAITHARMVSMAQLLERVPLLVRGMARDTGKQVRLEVQAGRAELDKAVAERIFPALVHLIRNAVDHAIEPAEERRSLGKPGSGTITVRCFERAGNQLELSVSDDGSGVDRERVASKAGVPPPRDDRALLDLITRPGLSTRDVASERSGRGMGMDIVKRVAVDVLGGELRLETTPHRGSTFTLRVPMSISILESFTLRCGAQPFVVPLAMVEEIVELERASVTRGPIPLATSVEAKLLRRRGESIPLFELASFFALTPGDGLRSALIVNRDGERFAFSVDHMLSQQEVVIRPIDDPLVKVPGVTGTTDLGDGRPTLVLDLWALSRVVSSRPREETT